MITYTQELIGDIDINETFKELMETSTGSGSAYIKAKETLNEIMEDKQLSNSERGALVAQTISQITLGITQQAMNTALAIEKENRDSKYLLTKMREDTKLTTAQIAKLEKDIEIAEANKDNTVMTGWKMQAELYRDYGVATYLLSPTIDTIVPQIDYLTSGTKVNEDKLAKASLYSGYAKSYRQDGLVTMAIDSSTGYLNSASGTVDGMTYWQTMVAKRQEQGFDDNMRQHIVNGSASMMSMLLSTEASGIDYTPYLAKWTTAIDYLNVDK